MKYEIKIAIIIIAGLITYSIVFRAIFSYFLKRQDRRWKEEWEKKHKKKLSVLYDGLLKISKMAKAGTIAVVIIALVKSIISIMRTISVSGSQESSNLSDVWLGTFILYALLVSLYILRPTLALELERLKELQK